MPPVGASIHRRGGEWEFRRGAGKASSRERVEGEERLINDALKKHADDERRRSRLRRSGWTPAKVVAQAGIVCGVLPDRVYGNGKRPAQVRARSLACKWLIDDLGLTGAFVSRLLRIAQPTVSQSIERGRGIARDLGMRMEEVDGKGRIQ